MQRIKVVAFVGLAWVFCLHVALSAESGAEAEKQQGEQWAFTPDPKLPNVLILGDSISIGYTLEVRKLLAGKANVYRPLAKDERQPFNCAGTSLGAQALEGWLGSTQWAVVHFNWGLHDIKHESKVPGNKPTLADPPQASLEQYGLNLDKILGKLEPTGAKLIFATTTPVVPGAGGPVRDPEDPVRYNAAAVKIMAAHGVAVNDLYNLVLPRLESLQIGKNVHFNPEGSKVLAGQVAAMIEQRLPAVKRVQGRHIVVAYDASKWRAVPANNGGNGPGWQWGDELLVGFTQGDAVRQGSGHQVDDKKPLISMLARSVDGGESWQVSQPERFQGCDGFKQKDAVALAEPVDFTHPGFLLRVECDGYHGNTGRQWFYSLDKGHTWSGPYTFGGLTDEPELAGRQWTSRSAYLVNGKADCFLFMSARKNEPKPVTPADKVFLARTTDGGRSFHMVAWVVPPSDDSRAVMPAPVRISAGEMVVAIRRRNDPSKRCWIDCYQTVDNGQSWAFLSRVGDTGAVATNGNPPAMIALRDGRLCCVYGNRDRRVMLVRFSADNGRTWGDEYVLRDELKSVNGSADLGYPRLFQRPDGKLVTAYFWCSPARPETHIEATLFDAP